jgi:hypothetical protein
VGIIPTWAVVAIVAAVGCVMAVVGLRQLRSERRFRANAVTTTGRIVSDFRLDGEEPVPERYYPVLSFRTEDGRDVLATSRSGRHIDSATLRDIPVPILYDPDDPTEAALEHDYRPDRLLPIIFIVLGLAGVVAAALAAFGVIPLSG